MFYPVMGKPQTALLLDHFKVKRSISALEAAGTYKIRSLSRRINDLEALGHRFHRSNEVDTAGQRYVRYFYTGKHQLPPALRLVFSNPEMAVAA